MEGRGPPCRQFARLSDGPALSSVLRHELQIDDATLDREFAEFRCEAHRLLPIV